MITTIKQLSQYQIDELKGYFVRNEYNPIQKIGVDIETGEVVIRYEDVGSYPELKISIKTETIPINESSNKEIGGLKL